MGKAEWYVLLMGAINETATVIGPFGSEAEATKHAEASGRADARVVCSHAPEPRQQRETPAQTAGDGASVVMPFGKHKGQRLEDIPTGYLEWCLREMDRLRPELAEEMENQIRLRAGEGVVRKAGR